jgi:hypothetical protein
MKEAEIFELDCGERAQFRLSRSASVFSLLTVDDLQLNSFWFEVDRITDEV